MRNTISLALMLLGVLAQAGNMIGTQDIAPGTTFNGTFIGDGSGLTGVAGSAVCSVGAGQDSVVCAGVGNNATGVRSSALGGANNIASQQYSFAIGQSALADQPGCFVWNDVGFGPQNCRGVDLSWNVYAKNGVYFETQYSTFTGQVAASRFVGAVQSVSSYTYVTRTNFTSTIFIGVATVTVVADGFNPVEISWSGTYANDGNSMAANFTQDGAFYTGFSSTIGLMPFTTMADFPTISHRWVLNNPIPSAGPHTYTFFLKTDAGTATTCAIGGVCQWGARVLH